MKKLLLLSLSLLVANSAFADFSVRLDAGRLRVNATTPMPFVGTTSPFTNGSLLLLIAAGGDMTFSNTLTAGKYVSGNDIVLAAAGFNISGGTDETVNTFSIITTNLTLSANDQIALRWFPQITYSQYLSNPNAPATTAGQNYGTYSPAGGVPPALDGGNNWQVPTSGQINLNFFTSDSGGGGAELPAQGYASFIVAVPEPSTWSLVIGSMALLAMICIRSKRAIASK